jgi:hypothetical protein
MKKIDLKKDLKALYTASAKEVVQVAVPPMRFLMVDGIGDPNTSKSYAEAIEALFSVSYTAKFIVKKGPQQIDYAVMPLEGLWWADDLSAFTTGDKAKWKWTAMIMQPDFVTKAVLDTALAEVRKKKSLPGVDRLRLEELTEGRCAQVLHIGPFSEGGPTIARLHEFIETKGVRVGKHHEIYLSDIRRAEPSRWKTILRQPMK